MDEYVIETNNLTKRYGCQTSVDSVNLHVPKGKVYGLLGTNGAGKTTTMKMLLNLAKPTGGSITLFGQDLEKVGKKTYYRIGSMIEQPGFYANLTMEENLKILARLRGRHRKDTVHHALFVVGLEAAKHKLFKNCSLGMKQRLGIAAAIMHEPELLILDEPVNGLDPVGICEIRNYLLQLCREKGTSILLSSHVLGEMEQMADVIGIMQDGRLIEETDMDRLHRRNRKYIEFEVSDVNAAAVVLERNFGQFEYAVTGGGMLQVFGEADSRGEINSSFVENGVKVANITVCEEKLEDYFRNMMGDAGRG